MSFHQLNHHDSGLRNLLQIVTHPLHIDIIRSCREWCRRSLWISLLPFSPPHALAKCVVLLCDRLIACEVAAGPPLFASLLRVQLALFVAVGVLLASARATESLFFF